MRFGKIVCVLVVLTILSTSTVHAAKFSDLNGVSWAQDAINFMADNEYIGGYPDGTFKPQQVITRAELVTIINKMNRFDKFSEIAFKDVEKHNWYYNEIRKSVFSGAITGFPDGTFKPNAPVTREQIAVIIDNLYKFEYKTDRFDIEDITDISNWAKESVEKVVSNGIMTGYEDKTFRGKQNITRAEAIVVLNKVFSVFGALNTEMVIEESKPTPSPIVNPIGSGNGGADVIQPVENREELEAVLSGLEDYVLPKLTTTLQRDAANIVMDSISKYLSNPSYDFDSDVASAKSLVAQMTDEEQLAFENAITSSIPISELNTLNQKFRLINY